MLKPNDLVYTLIITLICAILISPQPTLGYDVSLSWDTNPDATFYKVFWGQNSREYTNESEVVTSTRYLVEGLPSGVTYYFAVRAYNDCGNFSEFSDEVISSGDSVWIAIPDEISDCPEITKFNPQFGF